MPLYEYQCKKCGHRFERIQTYSAEDAKECPLCQGEVERLISTPARAHFKGSGFYSTDYAPPLRASRRMAAKRLPRTVAPKPMVALTRAHQTGSAAKTDSTSAPAASTSSTKSETGRSPRLR